MNLTRAITIASLLAPPAAAQPLSIAWEVTGHPRPTAIARSASGMVAVVGDWGDLVLMRDTGSEFEPVGRIASVWRGGVELSPDGSIVYFLPSYEDYVAAFDTVTGEQLALYGPSQSTFVLSRDGRILVGQYGGSTLNVWYVEDPTHPVVIKGPTNVRALAVADDGSAVAAAWNNGTIVFYDPADGAERTSLSDVGEINGMTLSPDAALVAGSDSTTLRVWDITTGELVKQGPMSGGVGRHGFSPRGDALLVRTAGNDTAVVDYSDLSIRFIIPGARYSAFDGTGATVTAGGHITVYDAATGESLRRVAGHGGTLRSVRFMPDGEHLLAASNDGNLVLWNLPDASALTSVFPIGGDLWCMDRSPQGDRVAMAPEFNGPLRVFSWPGLEEIGATERYLMSPTVSFGSDGRRLLHGYHDGDGFSNDAMESWVLEPAVAREWLTWTYSSAHTEVNLVASPDGAHALAAGNDPAIYSMTDGHPERLIAVADQYLNRVAWPRPGNMVLVLGRHALQLDRASTGEFVAAVEGNFDAFPETLAVDPRGRFALAAQTDSSLHAWRLPDLRELGSLTSPSLSNITAMDVSPDGRYAAIGRSDGGLVLLNIPEWPLCRADCNDDGRLNINDFICFQARWQRQEPYADFNADDVFTIDDLTAFHAEWRRGCD